MKTPSLEDNSIIAWMLKNEIKTESGKKFDFKSHPFWYDVLTDWSPNIVMLKAAQMGGTTALSLKMLWAMKRFGLNTAYTMPTSGDATDFVGSRFNPIIRQNPIIDSWVVDKDSVEQKRIGNYTAYFRGTMTERTALSFPADLLVHDEEDRSNRLIIEQYQSRLQASAFKWQWHLSNPSVPGNGVMKYWKDSDQKHWFINCNHCAHKQFLSWPESIDIERKAYICKKCKGVLTDEARRYGSWHGIKTDVKPEYSGYWFNLMMAPWVTAEEIIKHSKKSPDYFYNYVLGLPYAGSGNKLNEEEFFANVEDKTNDQSDPIIIGVDPGLPIWYVIGNKQGIFYNGHCDDWDHIERLMIRFPKAIVVSDQGGDLTPQRAMREKYPGRFYLCWYNRDKKSLRLIEWGRGKQAGEVRADRNQVIQQVVDELRMGRMPMQGKKEDWWEAWLHFANIYRELEEDAAGNERVVWKRGGPDHLVHAIAYWRIGIDKFQNDGARFVGASNPYLEGLNIKPSYESYNDTMPLPKGEAESKDWRDL
jgi:hypothetical protein